MIFCNFAEDFTTKGFMNRLFCLLLSLSLFVILLSGCGNKTTGARWSEDSTFRYAKNISVDRKDGYSVVKLADPWKQGKVLHQYVLVNHKDSARLSGHLPAGTVVYVPIHRAVVFTAAHANLLELLHDGSAIVGVADPQYMHITDIQKRLTGSVDNAQTKSDGISNVGNSMKPDVEKIIGLNADAIFLSPFENSGGYGRLEDINVPIIECADYMETGPLGRAEWMKFYGMLTGREAEADSIFTKVEKNYNELKKHALTAKKTLSVLPERKTGSVWYVPGGQSSVGLMYKDAGGKYAYSSDSHTGSLPLPFETVLDKMGNADVWLISYNGVMTRSMLPREFSGYSVLRAYNQGEIYGCPVDVVPYFEEVSWHPDWLLADLIQIFHPDLSKGNLRYYHKL
mgnify:CR=1 FL=1